MDFMSQSTKTQFKISLQRYFAHRSLDLSPELPQQKPNVKSDRDNFSNS